MASDCFDPKEVARNTKASADLFDHWVEKNMGIKTDRAILTEELATLRIELAEEARLNGMGSEREARLIAERDEARRALSTIQDMATGTTAHEGNRLRQIADVARKAMEGGR